MSDEGEAEATARPSRDPSRHDGKSHQQLIEELKLLEETLDALPDAVAAFDAADCLIFFNTAYDYLYGEVAQKWPPGITYRDMVRILLNHASPDDAKGREEDWMAERIARHQHHGKPKDRYYTSGKLSASASIQQSPTAA